MDHRKYVKYKYGFTLIELLVVIAIIGVLSSTVLASLNTARMKSRDAKRLQDLRQVRIALELYFTDNNSYPLAAAWVQSFPAGNASWTALQTTLAKYIPRLPVDPRNSAGSPWGTGNYSYAYLRPAATVAKYDLVGQLENTSDANRCAVKCWKYHTGGSERPWCGTSGCGGTLGYSPYLFADH